MLPWITALKVFNEGKPSWCVPRKGTADYEEIQKLRRGKSKTESPKEQHVTIPMAKKEEPWTPFPDTPPSSPKPRAETLEEKAQREAKEEMIALARRQKEVRDKYEREHREGGITIPKTADEPMKEMGQGKYPTAPLFTEAQLADLNRFAKDYKRFGLKVNESRKAPIRNAEYRHKVGTDTVTFFWRVEGKNIYDERTQRFTEHDDHFYYVKTYTFGKPLPDDPPIEHPGEEKTKPKEKKLIVQKGTEGRLGVEGYTAVAVGREADNTVEVAFFKPGVKKAVGKEFFKRQTTDGKTATFKPTGRFPRLPEDLKTVEVTFDLA